jgi:hypothetical protein
MLLRIFFSYLALNIFFLFSAADTRAQDSNDSDVIILDDASLPWNAGKEPQKARNNLARIIYDRNEFALSENDKLAIKSMVNIQGTGNFNMVIKSYSSIRKTEQKAREAALRRVEELQRYLRLIGYNIDNAKIKVYGASQNEQNLDYIDIDKL